MTDSTERERLVAFVRDRVAEDEELAQKASPGPWRVNSPTYPEYLLDADGNGHVSGGRWGGEARIFDADEDALHIARHDPARVLREVAAKRHIVDQYVLLRFASVKWEPAMLETLELNIRALASIWSDHPDYRSAWSPAEPGTRS